MNYRTIKIENGQKVQVLHDYRLVDGQKIYDPNYKRNTTAPRKRNKPTKMEARLARRQAGANNDLKNKYSDHKHHMPGSLRVAGGI